MRRLFIAATISAIFPVPLPQSGGSGCHRAAGQGSTPKAAHREG